MLSLLIRYRVALDRWLQVAGLLSVAAVMLIAVVVHHDDWPEQRFLLFYIAPLFGFGAAWARERLRCLSSEPAGATIVDALAFSLGAIRIWGGWGVLPYSGHMLFLAYAALGPATRSLRFVALLLIGITTVFKLVLWSDVRSWSLGLMCGVALAVVRGRASGRPLSQRFVRINRKTAD